MGRSSTCPTVSLLATGTDNRNIEKGFTKMLTPRRMVREAKAAELLRETGRWLVVAEPRCFTCGGDLDSMGDMTICVECGDEWESLDALWDNAIAEARKAMVEKSPNPEGGSRPDRLLSQVIRHNKIEKGLPRCSRHSR